MRRLVIVGLLGTLAAPAAAYDTPAAFATANGYSFNVPSARSDHYDGPGDDTYVYGDYNTGVYVGFTSTSFASQTPGFSPQPSVLANSFARGNYSGGTNASAVWFISGTLGRIGEVASNIPVLLNGLARLSIDASFETGSSAYHASSQASIFASGAAVQSYYCGGVTFAGTGDGAQTCGEHSVSDSFTLTPTATDGIFEGHVSLLVRSSVAWDTGAATFNHFYDDSDKRASAFIDPVVTIDPAFLALHPGTRLTFSQGVFNGNAPDGIAPPPPAGAVPEPASWALMLGGFGVVGSALRRRRTDVVTT